ncbi:MAG TPA: hypothetical protein VNZ44_05795, partial [Pyrinomonadaceae bacterium]|nr:hypothetical protein [Pyrinomonadaceae bacterium]
PRLRWIEQLVDLVRAGKWTQVRMLPGNGAEHVYDILVQNLSGARILPIDLAPINDRDELLRIIADQADEPATAFAADGRANFHQIAKRAAEGSDRLAIVVENWGSFAHEKTPDDLHQIALALTGFKNVTDRPKVAIVLLSPTRAHHLLPAHRVGSLLQLQSVFPSETDGEEIERWARSRLLDVAEDDIRAVLSAARGQLCAIQVAVNPALRNQNERLQAIRHAHHDAGQSILGTVGTCCREVLLGNSREPGCLTALKEAGILEERAGEYHPHVAEWTDSWGEARRSH